MAVLRVGATRHDYFLFWVKDREMHLSVSVYFSSFIKKGIFGKIFKLKKARWDNFKCGVNVHFMSVKFESISLVVNITWSLKICEDLLIFSQSLSPSFSTFPTTLHSSHMLKAEWKTFNCSSVMISDAGALWVNHFYESLSFLLNVYITLRGLEKHQPAWQRAAATTKKRHFN